MKASFDEISNIILYDEASAENRRVRDFMPLLGCTRWEKLNKAIQRAMESCETSDINVLDHFRDVTKMIELTKGAQRKVADNMLTHYTRYLIVQNDYTKKRTLRYQ